ncbi:hypothetical protein AGMMS4956_04380 [Bacteroidia bacterium]|nr:hypothetical protein AGMMS4956_04380 [Bacteroidia bacterium]
MIKLKLGNSEAFEELYQSMIDENLYDVYSNIIEELLKSKFWSIEGNDAPRVNWQDGDDCRKIREDIFKKSGLYLWGYRTTPRYIGITTGRKTEGSFSGRFSTRYIWQKYSQCELAQLYVKKDEVDIIKCFPKEVQEWYEDSRKKGTNYTARLRGAADFAEHGINNVWFSLFPSDNKDKIGELEKALIREANKWNINHGLNRLINKQHNK